ncbi:MAG: tRNA(fMet)-specific endonuclease VapC [Chloroflexia bacterium]|jgi:tRNA(fMet)-specific endonuclease VapC|nr:tRNA(fMet)-specific endonuclease VapC [Chloroflexia bacterium]
MYLLDTNYCSRIIQGESGRITRFQGLSDLDVVTSAIVRGELVFMAENSEQRESNLARVILFFRDVGVYPLDDETAEIYGQLKARLARHFGPKDKSKRRGFTIAQVGLTDNDLWIAATAIQHDLILVSSDSDFQRIQEAWAFPVEAW